MEGLKEQLMEKLENEYECFFQDMMRTSKENVFANSGQIELKKRFSRYLQKEAKHLEDEEKMKRLYYTNNLMETCYRYALDHPEESPEAIVTKILFSS